MVRQLRQDRRLDQAFLWYDRLYRTNGVAWTPEARRQAVYDLANIAQDIGRVESAKGYWRDVVEMNEPGSAHRLSALEELARQFMRERKDEEARGLVDWLTREAREASTEEWRLIARQIGRAHV
jgi:tetratricopeptide (TPR) repeat protein